MEGDCCEEEDCNLEPLRNEEALLLNILNFRRWNKPVPPPPVWEHYETEETDETYQNKDKIPFHYCLINTNQFLLCKCEVGPERNWSSDLIMSNQKRFSMSLRKNSSVGANPGSAIDKMGLSKEQRLQRRATTQLAKQLKNNCDKIMSMEIPFVVDSTVLKLVSEAMDGVLRNINYLVDGNSEDLEYHDLVMFLSDFFQQTPSLCIASTDSNNSQSSSSSSSSSIIIESSKVQITSFKSLQFLELRNTPPSKILGLNSFRTKLKKLKCSRCLTCLNQILQSSESSSSSASSSSVPSVWPELKEIDLSFNRIGSLEEISVSAFELCPSVEILNLSRNRIVSIDDKFSRVMSSLSVLNLSYNQLTCVPPIPPNVKILLLSHNYITTLSNSRNTNYHDISFTCSLKNIEVLDLSTNLVSKSEDLLPLKELNNLKKLSLIGNPISFIDNYRNTVGGYLSRFVITRKFELDKKNLSSSEVRWGIEQCKQGNFIPFIPKNSLIIGEASAAMMSNSISMSSYPSMSLQSSTMSLMKQSSSSSRLENLKSMTQSYDSGSSSLRSSKRKKPKIREIMTIDFAEGDESSGGNSRNDSKENCDQKSSRSPTPSTSTSMSEKSETLANETRQAITALREKYGPENWLLRQAGNEVGKILQIPNRPINYDLFSRSLPPNSKENASNFSGSSAYYDCKDKTINRSGRFTNEELLVISHPRKFSTPCSETVLSPITSPKITSEDSDAEFYSCFNTTNPENVDVAQKMDIGHQPSIFDVEAEPADEKFVEDQMDPKSFESFRIFQTGELFKLIVYDDYLMEINPEDCIVLNKWDLNCLISLEEERCDNETETVEFRLKFDTMRKQMRERGFIMSAKDFIRFDKIVSPYIEERTLQEFTEALQCTKCYAQFSRAMAGRTVKQENGEAPREVSICPNTDCGNDVLVTLDNIPLPNNECLDLDMEYRGGPLRTSTPISSARIGTLSQSIPKGRSPRMLDFLKLLPSSLTNRRNQNNSNSKASSFDEDLLEVGSSAKSITPTSTDTVGNTKSESDIEVLSNDSSSIEVLARNCGDSGSEIDAEEAVELPVMLDNLTNKSLNKTIVMTESTSSSSCADSIITTYERHLLPISQPLSTPSTACASTTASSLNSLTSTSTLTGGHNSYSSHSQSHMTVPVRYDYVNFARTDHRLQLWTEISVFKSADERLLALTKCMIISDSQSNGSFLGIVIFSSRKVYLYRITGNEGDKPQDWLQKVNAFDLSKFTKLDVLIGRHGVGVDFSGKYFAFVFRDSERTSGFLEFFMSDICGEMDPPPMVRDFSQTQKSMLSPTNPISYFGIMRYSVCDSEKPYPVSAVLLTNEEVLLITDLGWMAGRCDIVNAKHGRQLSTLRQVESMESDGTFLRLVFEIEPEKLANWDLSFETEHEKLVFEKHLTEVKSEIPFICLSQPLEP